MKTKLRKRVFGYFFLGICCLCLSTPTSSHAANSVTFSNLNELTSWGSCNSSGGVYQDHGSWGCCTGQSCAGSQADATFSMTPDQSVPSEDGQAREYTVGGPPYADVLYWVKVGSQSWSNEFQWDFDFYADSNSKTAQALEFDMFQVVSNEKYMFGSQCDYGDNHKWQGWSATKGWVDTSFPCQVFSPSTWHHIAWRLERIPKNINNGACPADQLHYISLTIDGVMNPITNTSGGPMCEAPAATSWGDVMGVQSQQDTGSSGTGFTEWIDNENLTIWSSNSASQNDAQFMSQSVPTTMNAGQTYPVSITMYNGGGTNWTGSSQYGLGSQNPQNNQTWGLERAYVPSSATIASGNSYTYSFNVVAPSAPGVYNFQWQMLQENVQSFGDYTPNVAITVQSGGGNPVPTLSSISPSSATVGGSTLTFTANGGHFINSSVVQWNGASLATTFISSTQVTAVLPASDLATVGIDSVTVFNPSPGGGTSGIQTFSVLPAVYSSHYVTQVVLSTMTVGQTYPISITMLNNGTVPWNNVGSYPFGLGSQNPQDNLTWGLSRVHVPSTATIQAGQSYTFPFNVVAPSTAGVYNFQWRMLQEHVEWFGDYTANVTITVQNVGNPVPILSSISPSSATVGGSTFTLTANGGNFIHSSVVQWNGASLATTFISSTTLSVLISSADIASANISSVTVFNPSPGGGTSPIKNFATDNPVPILTSITPSSATAGSNGFTVFGYGTNFVSGASVMQWNGKAYHTTFYNNKKLGLWVPKILLAQPGTATINVFTSGPGGGTSASETFTILTAGAENQGPPEITSSASVSGTAGNAFSYQITAINNPTNYNAQGLPAGLSVNSESGLISGIPALSGAFNIGLSASNDVGIATATLALVLRTGAAAQTNVSLVPGDLSGVRVYPNPWRSDKHSGLPITFDQLSTNSTIKIFTASGHWIKNLPTSNSSVTWDLTNDWGDKVASGLYFYLITDDQGQKKTGQIAVIR